MNAGYAQLPWCVNKLVASIEYNCPQMSLMLFQLCHYVCTWGVSCGEKDQIYLLSSFFNETRTSRSMHSLPPSFPNHLSDHGCRPPARGWQDTWRWRHGFMQPSSASPASFSATIAEGVISPWSLTHLRINFVNVWKFASFIQEISTFTFLFLLIIINSFSCSCLAFRISCPTYAPAQPRASPDINAIRTSHSEGGAEVLLLQAAIMLAMRAATESRHLHIEPLLPELGCLASCWAASISCYGDLLPRRTHLIKFVIPSASLSVPLSPRAWHLPHTGQNSPFFLLSFVTIPCMQNCLICILY